MWHLQIVQIEPGNVNKTIVTKFQFKYFKILNGV